MPKGGEGGEGGEEEEIDWYHAHNDAEWSGESAAEEVIDIILTKGGLALYERHINEQKIPYAAAFAIAHMASAMQFAVLARDDGEPSPKPWAAEEEPPSLNIDTWARGAVKIMKREAPLEITEPEPPQQPRSNASKRRPNASHNKTEKGADNLPESQSGALANTTDVNPAGVIAPLIRNRDKELAHTKQIQAIEAAARKKNAAAESTKKREALELAEHEKLMKETKVGLIGIFSSLSKNFTNLFLRVKISPLVRMVP
jgi:hypothetical protein